jgi:plastocyanin
MSMVLAAGWLLVSPGARAEARGQAVSRDEFARLQQEVRELRQMLIQAMQIEQQHHDLLLKLIQPGAGSSPAPLPSAPASSPPHAAARAGVVSGSVQVKGIPASQPVFVFVDNLRTPAVHGRSVDIVQKDKQFSPQVTAVQRGTAVNFPNEDRVAHNVFSLARRNTFDVGMVKSGERGRPVVLGEPGIIEIYCDIHSRMWAEVLVTPNPHFTRVTNGTFHLSGVPTGQRVIAVWTAGAQPVRQTVEVTGDGVQVDLSLDVPPRRSHNNKVGQAYSSYGE